RHSYGRQPHLRLQRYRESRACCGACGEAHRRLVLRRFGRRCAGGHGGYRDAWQVAARQAGQAHRTGKVGQEGAGPQEGRQVMLSVLLESALRSLLLGIVAWALLKIFRVRNPRAERAVWFAVLVTSIAMPGLM